MTCPSITTSIDDTAYSQADVARDLRTARQFVAGQRPLDGVQPHLYRLARKLNIKIEEESTEFAIIQEGLSPQLTAKTFGFEGKKAASEFMKNVVKKWLGLK